MSNSGGRRLKQWLVEQIQSGQYSGLQWEDESRTMFRIPWKHAGKQDYNQEVDASIFKVWQHSSSRSVGTLLVSHSAVRKSTTWSQVKFLCDVNNNVSLNLKPTPFNINNIE